jgi:hypothetical protein
MMIAAGAAVSTKAVQQKLSPLRRSLQAEASPYCAKWPRSLDLRSLVHEANSLQLVTEVHPDTCQFGITARLPPLTAQRHYRVRTLFFLAEAEFGDR